MSVEHLICSRELLGQALRLHMTIDSIVRRPEFSVFNILFLVLGIFVDKYDEIVLKIKAPFQILSYISM